MVLFHPGTSYIHIISSRKWFDTATTRVCPISGRTFLIPDSLRLTVPKVVAATPVFGRVYGEYALPSTPLLHPDQRIRGLTVLPLADSSEVQVGDIALAIGNPFGLGDGHC